MDGLWYIDICHFLSANRLLTKSVHRVNPPVSKSGDGKKTTTQLMGILLGLHRSMLILLTDYMVILLFVCWLLKLTQ